LRAKSSKIAARVEELANAPNPARRNPATETRIVLCAASASEVGQKLLRLHGEQKQGRRKSSHQAEGAPQAGATETTCSKPPCARGATMPTMPRHDFNPASGRLGALKHSAAGAAVCHRRAPEERDILTKQTEKPCRSLAGVAPATPR